MEEVAAEISMRGGGHVSPSLLSMLRSGKRRNPSMKTLEAIAVFFGVPMTYFFDDEVVVQLDKQFEIIEKIDKLGAAKSEQLSPEAYSEIAGLIEEARKATRKAFGDNGPGRRAKST